MKRILFLLLLSSVCLFAIDSDLDGVSDGSDRCPNTPFGDLADDFGCTKKTLYTDTAYDIILGIGYADTNYNTLEKTNTLTTTLQADMYRGNLSAQILTSYYRSDESGDKGWNDTQAGVYFKSNIAPALNIQVGGGLILPTFKTGYDNEAVDVFGSLYAKYDLDESYNLFGGYTYTFVNDKPIANVVQYHDTNSFTVGAGYSTHHSGFINIAYEKFESIYVGVETFKTLSLNGMVPIDSNWFILGNYRYGLSDSASDNEVILRVGYYF